MAKLLDYPTGSRVAITVVGEVQNELGVVAAATCDGIELAGLSAYEVVDHYEIPGDPKPGQWFTDSDGWLFLATKGDPIPLVDQCDEFVTEDNLADDWTVQHPVRVLSAEEAAERLASARKAAW